MKLHETNFSREIWQRFRHTVPRFDGSRYSGRAAPFLPFLAFTGTMAYTEGLSSLYSSGNPRSMVAVRPVESAGSACVPATYRVCPPLRRGQ